MRYHSDDAPRTAQQNVNQNRNNTSKNVASNKMFHFDESGPKGVVAGQRERAPIAVNRLGCTTSVSRRELLIGYGCC